MSSFQERFKGKTTQMGKDGIQGVLKSNQNEQIITNVNTQGNIPYQNQTQGLPPKTQQMQQQQTIQNTQQIPAQKQQPQKIQKTTQALNDPYLVQNPFSLDDHKAADKNIFQNGNQQQPQQFQGSSNNNQNQKSSRSKLKPPLREQSVGEPSQDKQQQPGNKHEYVHSLLEGKTPNLKRQSPVTQQKQQAQVLNTQQQQQQQIPQYDQAQLQMQMQMQQQMLMQQQQQMFQQQLQQPPYVFYPQQMPSNNPLYPPQNQPLYYTPQQSSNPYQQVNMMNLNQNYSSENNDNKGGMQDNNNYQQQNENDKKGNKKNYTAYTLKEYKDNKQMQNYNYTGLGPTLNEEEFSKQKEKRERMQEFAQQVKQYNQMNLPPSNSRKPKKEEQKEIPKNIKAKEYAKNVPIPKQKQDPLQHRKQQSVDDPQYQNENKQQNFEYEESEIEKLERAHMDYLNKIQQIKQQ